MAANLETLARDMEKYDAFSPDAVKIVRDAAEKLAAIKAPSSVELAEVQDDIGDDKDSFWQLGLDAREIGMTAPYWFPEYSSYAMRRSDRDIKTQQGGSLTVFSYHVMGEEELVEAGNGRLGIIIQDPGADEELAKAMKRGIMGKVRAVAIITNLKSDDFAFVDVLQVRKVGERVFASIKDAKAGSDEDRALGRLLVDRVRGSERYQQLQARPQASGNK